MNNNDLLNNPRVEITEITKKFSLRGNTSPRPVRRIPLELLHYNNKNGRIATLISKWEADNGYSISSLDKEKYNETIENYIIKSNEPAYKKTKKSIENISQREAGVVLNNGCVIDGNRRYTCLRRLYEETGDSKYAYFEAVILDPDITADEKEIKRLELELQHGQDEKVSYNPIESLIDVYKTISSEKLLSIKEYADNCGKTESIISKELKQAEIIVDFLEYIGANEKYYIAVDLQLDASILEIYNIKQKISDEAFWKKARVVLYDNMLVKPMGEIRIMMRDIKAIINSNYFDSYYDRHVEITQSLNDKLNSTEILDSEYIRENIRADEVLKRKMLENCNNFLYKSKVDVVKKLPIEKLEDIGDILNKLDIDSISHLSGEDKDNFVNVYNLVKEKMKEIERVIENSRY